MSIPVMEAHSGAFRSIPVRSGPFLLLYAPAKVCHLLRWSVNVKVGIYNFILEFLLGQTRTP